MLALRLHSAAKTREAKLRRSQHVAHLSQPSRSNCRRRSHPWRRRMLCISAGNGGSVSRQAVQFRSTVRPIARRSDGAMPVSPALRQLWRQRRQHTGLWQRRTRLCQHVRDEAIGLQRNARHREEIRRKVRCVDHHVS